MIFVPGTDLIHVFTVNHLAKAIPNSESGARFSNGNRAFKLGK